jgi:hypothetical protein
MKLRAFIICMLCFTAAHAGLRHGRVTDENGSGIPQVNIQDMRTGLLAVSDSGGYFTIEAQPGEQLIITHLAYQPAYYMVSDMAAIPVIQLRNKDVALRGVEILSDVARYKRDSAFNHSVYHKELGYAKSKIKPSVSAGVGTVGVGFDGIFSELALRASGKKKRYKRFASTMQADEQQRYINIRYNAPLVSKVTGINDSLATTFVNAHPMPYDFARAATDLEIKSWILYLYKDHRDHTAERSSQ